jgi:predicted metal-dependent phosphoesterase TrpH
MSDLITSTLDFVLRNGDTASFGWPDAPAAKIDLHCHSTYSLEQLRLLPGLTWHPLSAPADVYDLAKQRGMTCVTITDHDTIDGCKALLDERGPLDDFVIGEEVSVTFPEDGTVIHVNVYDINEAQHRELQRLRENFYEFTAYLRALGKLYVLNHMTWTEQHRVLTHWQVEAMLENFDVFEGINGTRSYMHNAFTWQATTGRHKTMVGGSDSHTYRVGTTYTRTQGANATEVLANIRAGRAIPCGAFGTPEKLREDVWLTIQRSVELRLTEETSRWQRLAYRTVRQAGRVLSPLVCLGYHKHQDLLIRAFARALPDTEARPMLA